MCCIIIIAMRILADKNTAKTEDLVMLNSMTTMQPIRYYYLNHICTINNLSVNVKKCGCSPDEGRTLSYKRAWKNPNVFVGFKLMP